MARYECFSRSGQGGDSLITPATKALEQIGFKVRSSAEGSISLIETAPVQRLRDRVLVQMDQTPNNELQCVVSNEAIATSKHNPCLAAFQTLINSLNSLQGVEVDCPVLQ